MSTIKKISPTKQPALHLIDHVWAHIQESTGHSWQRLNWAMSDALMLAIKAGMRFAPDDFVHIKEHYRPGYWMGESGGEYHYAAAVEAGNLSACVAFETWKKRPPFIIGGRRLAVGSKLHDFFSWDNPRPESAPEWMEYNGAKVSAFLGCDSFSVLTHWDQKGKKWRDRGAPVRRWTVTREGIKQANAAYRESRKKPEPEEQSAEAA